MLKIQEKSFIAFNVTFWCNKSKLLTKLFAGKRFRSRVSMHSSDYALTSCLSNQLNKPKEVLTAPSDRSSDFYWTETRTKNSDRVTLNKGDKIQVRIKKLHDFEQFRIVSVYQTEQLLIILSLHVILRLFTGERIKYCTLSVPCRRFIQSHCYLRYLIINYTGPTVSYWSPTVAISNTSISISLKHVTTCDLQVAQFR